MTIVEKYKDLNSKFLLPNSIYQPSISERIFGGNKKTLLKLQGQTINWKKWTILVKEVDFLDKYTPVITLYSETEPPWFIEESVIPYLKLYGIRYAYVFVDGHTNFLMIYNERLNSIGQVCRVFNNHPDCTDDYHYEYIKDYEQLKTKRNFLNLTFWRLVSIFFGLDWNFIPKPEDPAWAKDLNLQLTKAMMNIMKQIPNDVPVKQEFLKLVQETQHQKWNIERNDIIKELGLSVN